MFGAMIKLQNGSHLVEFINTIPQRAKPPKITTKYLKEVGYTSSNDRPIVAALKALDIIDENGIPTERYVVFRDIEAGKKLLPILIRGAYSDLYDVYPQAHMIAEESLKTLIAQKSDAGAATQGNILRTFKALTEYADWSEADDIIDHQATTTDFSSAVDSLAASTAARQRNVTTRTQRPVGLSVKLNIDNSFDIERLEGILAVLSSYGLVEKIDMGSADAE